MSTAKRVIKKVVVDTAGAVELEPLPHDWDSWTQEQQDKHLEELAHELAVGHTDYYALVVDVEDLDPLEQKDAEEL